MSYLIEVSTKLDYIDNTTLLTITPLTTLVFLLAMANHRYSPTLLYSLYGVRLST